MPGNNKKHRRGNGEGSIYQRKDGTWAAAVTVGVKPDGKPNRKFLYGKTRKEVADKLRDAKNKLDVGVMPGGDNLKFSRLIELYLENVLKPGIKRRTYNGYHNLYYNHVIPELGNYRLKDLTEEVIQDYLVRHAKDGNLKLTIDEETGEPVASHGAMSPSSIISIRRLIIAALEYAMDKGKLARNPAKKTTRPKASPKVNNTMTDNEMEQLAQKGQKYRYYAAYMFTLTTGVRRGEVLGMVWKDVDIGMPWATLDKYLPWKLISSIPMWNTTELKTLMDDMGVSVGYSEGEEEQHYGFVSLKQQMADDSGKPLQDDLKTDLSKRTLMITEEMILLLIFWRRQQRIEKERVEANGNVWNADNLVFCTRKGTAVYPRNFTKGWSENLRSMNIDHKRFHDLRHTVATIMLEDGEAINTVQEQLGHYDAGFTASRYGHVTAKMRNGAAVRLGERMKEAREVKETLTKNDDPESKIVNMYQDRMAAARKMK